MTTRREIKKNTKYLHDYETTEINTSRRRSRNSEEVRSKTKRLLRSRRDVFERENQKKNIMPPRVNGRFTKIIKQDAEEDDDDDEERNNENEEDEEEEEEDIDVDTVQDSNTESKKQKKNTEQKNESAIKVEGIHCN